jgi:protein-S-isoprenylcysteine O-methyltransferase Ste14
LSKSTQARRQNREHPTSHAAGILHPSLIYVLSSTCKDDTVILIKAIIFTFIVPGTVTILVPYWLLSLSDSTALPVGLFRYFGLLPVFIGAVIHFRCTWAFTFAGKGTPAPIDPPKELVVQGLYRYVRNPMYIGILSILLGEAVLFASWWLFEYTAIVFCLFFLFVLFYEEPALKKRFGESYREYCKNVPRWIPRRLGDK